MHYIESVLATNSQTARFFALVHAELRDWARGGAAGSSVEPRRCNAASMGCERVLRPGEYNGKFHAKHTACAASGGELVHD